jgi:hypothetical protein
VSAAVVEADLEVDGVDEDGVDEVLAELEVWPFSSAVSFASSEDNVDWAEETDSLRAVGSTEARV